MSGSKPIMLPRPMALREKNILSGFKAGGLYPYAPSHVLRHLPPPPSINDMASLEKAKRYISKLADVSERMETQLAIAEKKAKERKVLLQARKRQRTGKRLL
ncbi:MAG: hypothetical protein Q9178_005612 [Gyalolechia marmorata]